MATATFDKNIVIDDKAADIMIALLNKPAPPRPKISGEFREMTEEDWKCIQNRFAKLSEQNTKKQ